MEQSDLMPINDNGKIRFVDRKTKKWRFINLCTDLIANCLLNSGLFLDTVEDLGSMKVMIILEEDTTSEKVRAAIPYAIEMQKRLVEFQGPQKDWGGAYFWERLLSMKKCLTYQTIADKLNSKITNELTSVIRYTKDFEKAQAEGKLNTLEDMTKWEATLEYSTNGFNNAADYLDLFSIDDIKERLVDGINNLKEGRPAFIEGPITKQMVREKIRWWKNHKNHKVLEKMSAEIQSQKMGKS